LIAQQHDVIRQIDETSKKLEELKKTL